jgi:hypothetical protein
MGEDPGTLENVHEPFPIQLSAQRREPGPAGDHSRHPDPSMSQRSTTVPPRTIHIRR